MIREPIGEIDCPLCGRAAELHSSDNRPKVAPEGEGRASYPKKLFVICPPISGYRGCGTMLCNNQHAQQRLLERGRIFGAAGRPPPKVEPAPPPAPELAPRVEPPAAPTPKPTRGPLSFLKGSR